MKANTTAFIELITGVINDILPTTYDGAPISGEFPYCVVSGINVIPILPGDLTSFYIDLYADEKKQGAAVELEKLCDTMRNRLTGAVIYVPELFGAHLGFENQNGINDAEHDIFHRRLSMSARIFYI